jgi:DNA-binding CsgD family transcriptional regulator
MASAVWSFSEEMAGIDSELLLFHRLSSLVSEFDVEYCAFGEIKGRITASGSLVDHGGLLNYPRAWVELYQKKRFDKVDPVVNRTARLSQPFYWDDISGTLSNCERLFMAQAEDFGIRHGIVVPLKGARGANAVIAFTRITKCRLGRAAMNELSLLSVLFHSRILQIRSSGRLSKAAETLTVRQIECMYWVAQGKSAWDIGKILGLSENTVTYHIKEAMRRLETGSRTVAAIRCLTSGYFSLE